MNKLNLSISTHGGNQLILHRHPHRSHHLLFLNLFNYGERQFHLMLYCLVGKNIDRILEFSCLLRQVAH